MTGLWRVYNKHPHGFTHREMFQEKMYEIKAGEYVLLDYDAAIRFRSAKTPMFKDAQGAFDPKGFKCLVLEKHDDQTTAPAVPTEFICHFDGARFPSQTLLDKYVTANYVEKTFTDESLEKEIEEETKKKSKR